MKTTEEKTLWDLQNDHEVKNCVRMGHSRDLKNKVQAGTHEIVLKHTDRHDRSTVTANTSTHRTIPQNKLHLIRVNEFWKGLPRHEDGTLKGAAFPVLLLVDSRAIPQNTREQNASFMWCTVMWDSVGNDTHQFKCLCQYSCGSTSALILNSNC